MASVHRPTRCRPPARGTSSASTPGSPSPDGSPARATGPRTRPPSWQRRERPGGSAMPELRGVETIRASLSRELTGKKLKLVSVTNGKLTKRHSSVKEFRALLEGHTIKSVGRLGKNLVI